MIWDTLKYKDDVPFTLSFAFSGVSNHYGLTKMSSYMLAFSQEQSQLKNEWWDNMQLLKEDTERTTLCK